MKNHDNDSSIVPSTPQQHTLPTPIDPIDDVWDMALTGVLSENSKRTYKQGLVSFASFLLTKAGMEIPPDTVEMMKKASVLLPSVNFKHVIEYREALRDVELKNSTINVRLAAVHSMFTRMQQMELIDKNPADPALVKRLKVPNVSTTEGLTSQEAEKILKSCHKENTLKGKRDMALFAVMMNNGLRRSEVVQLTVDKFRKINGIPVYTIRIKGGKLLTIEFIEPVWLAIQNWLKAAGITEGPVFRKVHKTHRSEETVQEKRLTMSGVYDIIKNRTKIAGIKKNIHPHSMAHTYATLALLAGVPIQEVQISMGHSNTDTTFRYYRAVEQVGRSPARAIKLEWPEDHKEKM